VDEVPYDWLFPRASCVIHHGGCGTLSAVLRAGRPSVLLPQIPPQELFGRLLAREGLSAGMLDADTLEPAALAEAIRRAVTDERVRANCRVWQGVVAADRGLPLAVDLIEAHGK
jgi:UDP:flavonoid glycosyltransferase YjiC (YdhE family)